MADMRKILFLGNLPTADKRSVGGATLITQTVYNQLKANKKLHIKFHRIRKKWRPKFQLFDYARLFFRLPFLIKKSDGILVASSWDFMFFMLPVIIFWSKIFHKPVYYLLIGSKFISYFSRLPGFYQNVLIKALKGVDVLWVETKRQIAFLKELGVLQVAWMPNSRKRTGGVFQEPSMKNKYVFISRVAKSKGIDILLKVFQQLPDKTLDIFGPLIDYTIKDFKRFNNVHYKGMLRSEEVEKKLKEYDFLLLPTRHPEGYPGIIVEAFAAGTPVIATPMGGIPEILVHNKNGILLAKDDPVDELREVLEKMNPEKRRHLARGAYLSFEHFDADKNYRKISEYLQQ